MISYFAQLLRHFCQLPISPSRTGQRVEQPKSKSTQPTIRADGPPCNCNVNVQRRQEARRNGFLPCIQYPKGNAASSTTTASSHLSDDRNRVKEVEEGAAAADHVANNTDEQVAPLEENFNEDKVRSLVRMISPNSI